MNKKTTTKKLIDYEIKEQSPYEIIRNSYKNIDNVPISIIKSIIEHHFGSGIVLHEYNPLSLLVKVKVLDLLKAPVFNWCQNREPDIIRIPDIASYINKHKKPIQTILYLSYKNKKDIFEIIDGVHRFSALKHIYENDMRNINNCNVDFISDENYDKYYTDITWLYDSYIILNINFNASVGELIELRNSLNLTQPMPTVLMDDNEPSGCEKKKY